MIKTKKNKAKILSRLQNSSLTGSRKSEQQRFLVTKATNTWGSCRQSFIIRLFLLFKVVQSSHCPSVTITEPPQGHIDLTSLGYAWQANSLESTPSRWDRALNEGVFTNKEYVPRGHPSLTPSCNQLILVGPYLRAQLTDRHDSKFNQSLYEPWNLWFRILIWRITGVLVIQIFSPPLFPAFPSLLWISIGCGDYKRLCMSP